MAAISRKVVHALHMLQRVVTLTRTNAAHTHALVSAGSGRSRPMIRRTRHTSADASLLHLPWLRHQNPHQCQRRHQQGHQRRIQHLGLWIVLSRPMDPGTGAASHVAVVFNHVGAASQLLRYMVGNHALHFHRHATAIRSPVLCTVAPLCMNGRHAQFHVAVASKCDT